MKNNKFKTLGLVVLVSVFTATVCFFLLKSYYGSPDMYVSDSPAQVHYASFDKAAVKAGPASFTKAAKEVVPITVHIHTKIPPQQVSNGRSNGFWGGFPFSPRQYSPGKLASGSGVIISQDGYIVTNNHVIEGAKEIVVTLNNNQTYKAKVIGTDPNTDLSVIKIDAKNLPYATFGNSDNLEIGQWVLACGYPLNLQSTVTAGIISAKSRNIGISEGPNPIETYLQTDAAVNPGNSGGPLVTTDGKLIGINSAIASTTHSFAGYAYAIPSDLVRKVANDIMKYGKVQRAFLGIRLSTKRGNAVGAAFKQSGKPLKTGVEVAGISENGAAGNAGIEKGDRIVGIDDITIINSTDLLGVLARHHPGDKINVTYMRDGKKHSVNVQLKNKNGTTSVVKYSVLDALGANFVNLNKKQSEALDISGGVMVGNIGSGLLKSQTDMRPLFIIVGVGNSEVDNKEELTKALENQGNNVMIKGFYIDQNGRRITDMVYYALHDVKAGEVN